MVVGHHARLSPFVGVGAGHTCPVGIGKDGGHGGWLVLGVCTNISLNVVITSDGAD